MSTHILSPSTMLSPQHLAVPFLLALLLYLHYLSSVAHPRRQNLAAKYDGASRKDTIANTSSSVEFPPPLSMLERFKRAATFWFVAVSIVVQYYGILIKIKLHEALGRALTNDQVEQLWNKQHERGAMQLAEVIMDLKGFYVKSAQIISSRRDLFPSQYTEALSKFTDSVDPMPVELAKAVVQSEFFKTTGEQGERFEDVFVEFDADPLGAASVGQVHRARLSDKYGGRQVAVKIQRPGIESKLMGDIANLKAVSKTLQDSISLPMDYYTVFCELEKQLADEFDFVAEAVAMDRIYSSLIRDPAGNPRKIPLVMPLPVHGFVSKRVLVMDYLQGVPLSRAREEMVKRGIDPESAEAKIFGRKLLKSLTRVFGQTILETGYFHADPHPGNIFVLEDGQIGLIDFGQVKQISGRMRETLCRIMIELGDRTDEQKQPDLDLLGKLVLDLGVEMKSTAKPEAAAAVGIWLFDGHASSLPGGYDLRELSPDSPIKAMKSFGEDMVLAGRASLMIKGLASQLGIRWSLAKEWSPIAHRVLNNNFGESANHNRVRIRVVQGKVKHWGKARASGLARKLPTPLRSRVASVVLSIQERKANRSMISQN